MNLEGNTVLITGGSSGIGLELATRLLGRRNTVIVTGRNQAALESAQKDLPGLRTIQSALRGIARDDFEVRVGFAKIANLLSRVAPSFALDRLSKATGTT